jgi:hypothetical protein
MPKSQQSWVRYQARSSLRHSGIRGAVDEAVLNKVHRKPGQNLVEKEYEIRPAGRGYLYIIIYKSTARCLNQRPTLCRFATALISLEFPSHWDFLRYPIEVKKRFSLFPSFLSLGELAPFAFL